MLHLFRQKDKRILILISAISIILILLGVFILIKKNQDKDYYEELRKEAESQNTDEWVLYENEEFGFSIEHPQTWEVYEQTKEVPPLVNIYPKKVGSEPPFTHHDNVTQVSIFPQGVGTEGPLGITREPSLDLENVKEYKDYILSNGDIWATIFRPTQENDFWKPWGYVWASVRIENVDFQCLRDQKLIDMSECDPLIRGDQILRNGDINKNFRETEEKILKSFKLL